MDKDQAVLRTSIILSFFLGVVLGYKAKEWRIRYSKWRRDRLAAKLAEAQKDLDLQARSI